MTAAPVVRNLVRESLYVLTSRDDADEIAGRLVYWATTRGLVQAPPRLCVSPDRSDTCGLLGEWAAMHGHDRADVALPDGVGLWRIRLAFHAEGTEQELDHLGFSCLAQVVEDAVRPDGTPGPEPDFPYASLVALVEVDEKP